MLARVALAFAITLALACGETRKPIGDECLRADDCLSNVCSNRSCVSEPSFVTGGEPAPPEEPIIPDAGLDAAEDG